MRRDTECDIRKSVLDSCLLFAKHMTLGILFKLAMKWE